MDAMMQISLRITPEFSVEIEKAQKKYIKRVGIAASRNCFLTYVIQKYIEEDDVCNGSSNEE